MAEKSLILAVDKNRANLELLTQQLGQDGYETLSAASLEEVGQAIQGERKITLALIDLAGFDQRIWEQCEALREKKVPFILISPQRSPAIQRDSTKHGASGLLIRPLGVTEILEYVHTLLGD